VAISLGSSPTTLKLIDPHLGYLLAKIVTSGHKVFAPTGIGVLYGKKHLLEALVPW
jgi:cysteine sulfinate desulfinase/cysteine desulfurase-like protein